MRCTFSAENASAGDQIVVDYGIHDPRPNDSDPVDLLIAAIEIRRTKLGRAPAWSPRGCRILLGQERGAGVGAKSGSVNASTRLHSDDQKSQRKRERKKHWYHNSQKWRLGEARDDGLSRDSGVELKLPKWC